MVCAAPLPNANGHIAWLSEGFATYFAALWDRAARGDSAFHLSMRRIRTTVLNDTVSVTKRPVIDTIETNLPHRRMHRNSYEKGGSVSHMSPTLQADERAVSSTLRHSTTSSIPVHSFGRDRRSHAPEWNGRRSRISDWFFDQSIAADQNIRR